MAWPPVNHQDVTDAVTTLRAAPPAHVHPVADITATGVRSSTVYLRGDGVWATPSSTTTTTTGRTDLYPEDYGYNTAGTAAANQTALQNFINAITAGKTGVIRAGLLYQHNGVLTVPAGSQGGRLILDGELQGTVPASSAFKIQASGFHVEGSGTVSAANVTVRGTTLTHQKLIVDFCDRVTIEGINSEGSAATGFFSNGGTNYTVRDVTVRNSWADGFHNTNGSTGGRFRGTTAISCGDDGMAVVSYSVNAAICSDIDVQGHVVKSGGARGLAVVGASDVRMKNCEVYGCASAGVYIAVESSFNSYDTSDVRMMNLRINNSNTGGADHGAAMFYSSVTGKSLTDCSIDFMVADGTKTTASGWLRVVESGTPATSTRLSYNNIHLRGTGPATNVQGNMAAGVYEATNITRQATW